MRVGEASDLLPRLSAPELERLRRAAERTLLTGSAGLRGRDYIGQGAVEVPSGWLLQIIDRLQMAEALLRADLLAAAAADEALACEDRA